MYPLGAILGALMPSMRKHIGTGNQRRPRLVVQARVPIHRTVRGRLHHIGDNVLCTHVSRSKTYKPNGARERARRARQLGLCAP